MKILLGFSLCSLFMVSSAYASENLLVNEDVSISAAQAGASGQVVCNKMLPPQCRVDGRLIKTNKLGVPELDADGNFIFLP